MNDTSYESATTVDTSMNTSGDTSYFQAGEESFLMSPISNIRNECNLHFATWLQSKEFDASGIVSQDEEEDGHLQQYSRDEFLADVTQDEYVSISEQQKKRGVNNRMKFPWVVSDVWDSIVSSNWKCWRQEEQQKQQQQPQPNPSLGMTGHPPRPISPFAMNPPLPHQQPLNVIKDSSYVVDALASEILPPLKRSGSEKVEIGSNNFGTAESSSVDKSSKDADVKVDKPSTSTSLIHHLKTESSCAENAPPQREQPTTIPTAASNTSVDIPSIVKNGTIGEFIWQEDSQRPNTTTAPPSLASSSLAGEDITMTSNHSCTYSASPVRAADSSSLFRGRSSRIATAELGGAVVSLLALDKLVQPPEGASHQTSTSPNTSTMITAAAVSIEDFDDSFPAVVQLPPEDNEEDNLESEDVQNISCHTPLMDTSVLNSSDGGGDDGGGEGGGPTSTKETMPKLRLKWVKGKNRHRSTK